jgi:hypothetical protein
MSQALTPIVVQLSRVVQFAAEHVKLLGAAGAAAAALYTTYKGIQLASFAITSYSKLQAALEARKGAMIGGQNVMLAVQTSLKRKGVAADVASMTAMVIAHPGKAIAGLALAGLAGAAVFGAFKKANQVQDGAIDPNGGLVVSKPAGSMQYQLDKDDYVLASTNPPISDRGRMQGQTAANQNLEPVVGVLTELLNTVKKGTSVNIDGNKLTSAIVMAGGTKSS